MKKTALSIALAMALGLSAALPAQAQEAEAKHTVQLGLRTNLLTWAAGAPGIGIDLSIGNRWQVGVDGAYGNWDLSEDCEGVRIITAGVQLRRYFRPFGTKHTGRDVNRNGVLEYTSNSRGWFLGVDARYTHYNEQFFSSEGGTEGDAITGGLIGGYSFTLDKSGHWGVDALLGAGFVHKEYDKYSWYEPAQMNRITGSNEKNKFGITTAEVSITYKF